MGLLSDIREAYKRRFGVPTNKSDDEIMLVWRRFDGVAMGRNVRMQRVLAILHQ